MARGAARQGEAREVTRGVGANNLIEPIDARPVFTAFSATLPRSFYSNPRTSVRARSLGSRLYPRALSDSSLSLPLSVPNGDKRRSAFFFRLAVVRHSFSKRRPGARVVPDACHWLVSSVLDTPPLQRLFRGVSPTFLFLRRSPPFILMVTSAREEARPTFRWTFG